MPMNYGTLMFIILAQVSFVITLLAMTIFCYGKKYGKWANRKIDGIFFNSILKVIDTNFILTIMTAAINVKLVL